MYSSFRSDKRQREKNSSPFLPKRVFSLSLFLLTCQLQLLKKIFFLNVLHDKIEIKEE